MADFTTATSVTGMKMNLLETRTYKQRPYNFFVWTTPSTEEEKEENGEKVKIKIEAKSYNVKAKNDLIKIVFPDGTSVLGFSKIGDRFNPTELTVSATIKYDYLCYYNATDVILTL